MLAEVSLVGNEEQESYTWQVRLLLNDITQKGIGLFSGIPLMPGQEIMIRLAEPRPFFLRGRVVWCREYDSLTPIYSTDNSQKYSYRVGIKFIFESLEEERMVKSYCDYLAKELLYTNAA